MRNELFTELQGLDYLEGEGVFLRKKLEGDRGLD